MQKLVSMICLLLCMMSSDTVFHLLSPTSEYPIGGNGKVLMIENQLRT